MNFMRYQDGTFIILELLRVSHVSKPPDKSSSFPSRLMGRGEGYDEAFIGWFWPLGDLVGTRHQGRLGISWFISLEFNNVTEVGGKFKYCVPEITRTDLLFQKSY